MGIFFNVSGMSKADKKANAAKQDREAAEQTKLAKQHEDNAKAYRKSLKSGKSPDPYADRYLAREQESHASIARANAKDARDAAKMYRSRWF